MAILITNGPSDDPFDAAAKEVADNGISLYAVGESGLWILSTSPLQRSLCRSYPGGRRLTRCQKFMPYSVAIHWMSPRNHMSTCTPFPHSHAQRPRIHLTPLCCERCNNYRSLANRSLIAPIIHRPIHLHTSDTRVALLLFITAAPKQTCGSRHVNKHQKANDSLAGGRTDLMSPLPQGKLVKALSCRKQSKDSFEHPRAQKINNV